MFAREFRLNSAESPTTANLLMEMRFKKFDLIKDESECYS